MAIADARIEASQLGKLEAHFREVGLPELSHDVVRPRQSRHEALLGLPVILLSGGFLVAYYWTAAPRWLWPLLFTAYLAFEAVRQDIQRARLKNLSGRGFLVVVALAMATVGFWVWRGNTGAKLLPLVLLVAPQVLRAVVGAGFLPVQLARSLLRGVLAAGEVAAAIPAMLAVVFFVFITGDAWRLFGIMDSAHLVAGLCAVAAIVIGILWLRMRQQVARIAAPAREWVTAMRPATAAEAILRRQVNLLDQPLAAPPAGARRNMASTLTFVFFIRLLGTCAVIAAFFLVLGTLVIGPGQTVSYLGTPKFGILASLVIHGHHYVLSAPLIRVAAWLAALAGLFYVIVGLADSRERQAFIADRFEVFRAVVATWTYYEAAVDRFRATEIAPEPARGSSEHESVQPEPGDVLNAGSRKFDAGDFDGAEECWTSELDSPEGDVRRAAAFNLGLLRHAAGLDQDAKAYYQHAAELGNGAAAVNLAGMLMDEGARDDAARWLRAVIDANADEAASRKARRNLRLMEQNRIWQG